MSETDAPRQPGWPNLALAVVALVCVALSVYLTRVHLIVHYTDGVVGGLCNLSSKVNCNVAASSAWSSVAGVPVAVLGMGFYLATLVGAVAYHLKPAAMRFFPHFLVAFFGVSCIYSVVLGAVSAFVLGSICWACTSLYVLNVAALILARMVSGEGYVGTLRTLYRNLVPASVSASGLTLVGVFTVTVLAASWVSSSIGQSMAGGNDVERQAKLQTFLAQEYVPSAPIDAALWGQLVQGPSVGPADAPVTIVEFSDFECPFCGRLGPELEAIQRESDGKVRLVFHHLPLDDSCNPNMKRPFHKHACNGARAAVCAEAQGQFWPMHDRLFANSRSLAVEDVTRYGRELGLEMTAYEACLAQQSPGGLGADIEMARQLGLRGTPVMLVNGRKVTGARPRWMLDAIVSYELGELKVEPAKAPALVP